MARYSGGTYCKGADRMLLLCIALVFQFVFSSFKVLKNTSMLLTCIAVFHMFSLSAQTPHKDSGADGLDKIKALQIGDTLSNEFWTTVHSKLQNGDSAEFSFNKAKGKFILLDFWATWCTVCVRGFPKIDSLHRNLNDNVRIVLVNEKGNRDNKESITAFFEKYHSRFPYALDIPQIYSDSVLCQYFPHRSIPHYVLISPKGRVLSLGSIREFTAMMEMLDFAPIKNRTKAVKERSTK
ncbi:TlpA disulfide reductase family protein [Sphingobacterium sp. DR205]|uniref:TlpA family protein disulfide reductase n=1 Tax=Sphingobacterium sp. DR205 TaxID=2713573 RepID=UPI0013E48F82|nr:TlpA disulfide reductase family protein [Sphingobacterium sp. DR205]QIH35263.1 TlpA family protein disulfide reductase [Sphingobacterium sp. DR205]